MKKNYLMAVCLFLIVMSGCGNKEQASQQAEPVKVKVMTVVSSYVTKPFVFRVRCRRKTAVH